jgi:hypothetical protein
MVNSFNLRKISSFCIEKTSPYYIWGVLKNRIAFDVFLDPLGVKIES